VGSACGRGAEGNGEAAVVKSIGRPPVNTRTIALIALVIAVVVLILLLM
jgi:hypothetical protein